MAAIPVRVQRGGPEGNGQKLFVVPTYDEAGNVAALVAALEPIVDGPGLDVLVIDDGSPDGTGSIVAKLASTRPWLHLLERDRPTGLGSAYRAGFTWALDRSYGWIGEMDADLSHDPAVIPQMLDAAAGGADLVVGSRYVAGGGAEGWPLARRALSRGANRFARTLLRLGTRDVTAGFRLYSRRAVELILDAGTRCDGYGFQVEGAYLVERGGGGVVEVPIRFHDRRYGRSKMSRSIAIEAAKRCVRLAVSPPEVPRLRSGPASAVGVVTRRQA
ncbi:MAG: polyprenol monophosphomannose synthase [Actinomycetota bacterium]|nr:polyprenol monophosphomannose synthase [Actinomycetota bacterium]MDH5225003.1 polyprenol monophosphomannose synthase [Actinomycetota bacterium]MDH5312920.1 polyprenol monophosphomannose synthase [Actinomycetota bacterium]